MEQTPEVVSEEFNDSLTEEILTALFLLQFMVSKADIKEAYLTGNPQAVVASIDWQAYQASLSSIIPILLAAYAKGGSTAHAEHGKPLSKLDLSSNLSKLYLSNIEDMIQGLVQATANGVHKSAEMLMDQQVTANVAPVIIINLIGNIQGTIQGLLNARRAMLINGLPVKTVNATLISKSEAGLATRAANIAENESYGAVSEGRSTLWIQWFLLNEISAEATKTWFTKADELVCPVCGPLHNITIRITDQYPGGILTTPAHNKCRCYERLN